ncbi:MAG: hypothetical protein U0228_13995 [Myxococcaceae bacterium]
MNQPVSDTTAAVAAPMGEAIKRPQVEALLTDVFKLMDYPAKLDFKDMADGSLGVAVHFDGELPGITAGKRSYLVDCVQFWLNKVVNRPNVPRRWVNLGVNAFPEPRAPQGQQQQPQQPAAQGEKPAPAQSKGATPPKGEKAHEKNGKGGEKDHGKDKPARPEQKPARGKEFDERTLKPAADPRFTAAGKLLAEKSAKLGRVYGVMLLTPEQRALMMAAADEVKGQKVKAEGEGHWRRLVTVPDKLTVIPKKQVMPDYDDEDEEDE